MQTEDLRHALLDEAEKMTQLASALNQTDGSLLTQEDIARCRRAILPILEELQTEMTSAFLIGDDAWLKRTTERVHWAYEF